MRFFFDNNLSPHIARAMHCLNEPDGIDVVHLREKFSPDISDVEWIEHLSAEGEWMVVTFDHDIARRGAIKIAWKKAGLVGFVLRPAWQDSPPWIRHGGSSKRGRQSFSNVDSRHLARPTK